MKKFVIALSTLAALSGAALADYNDNGKGYNDGPKSCELERFRAGQQNNLDYVCKYAN
jgi:hypothetical protein